MTPEFLGALLAPEQQSNILYGAIDLETDFELDMAALFGAHPDVLFTRILDDTLRDLFF